jgi:hypothetical protein
MYNESNISAGPELICRICSHKSTNKRNLRYHIESVHNLKLSEYWNLYPIVINYNEEKYLIKSTCRICGKQNKNYLGLVGHINSSHNLSSKEYYDQNFKKEGEGICKVCGKETSFRGLSIGYSLFCSMKCVTNNKEIKEKRIKTNLERYGAEYPFQNESIKSKSKLTCLQKYGTEYSFQSENNKLKTQETNYNKFGTKYPLMNKEIMEKRNKTNTQRYGGNSPSQDKEVKEKQRKTSLQRYGAEYYSQTKEFRDIRESLGLMIPLSQYTEYEIYERAVRAETRKNEKELYKNWNGLDYYTGEKLITTKIFRKLYPLKSLNENLLCPSTDHKLSISYCFINKISITECATLENLCICSKSINSSKNYKTEEEFKLLLKDRHIINTNRKLI